MIWIENHNEGELNVAIYLDCSFMLKHDWTCRMAYSQGIRSEKSKFRPDVDSTYEKKTFLF